MKRGEVVVVAASGDFGKPRPAVIVQSDAFHDSLFLIICQMTSTVIEPSDFRVIVDASDANGLRQRSQIMTDRPITIRRTRIGARIGTLSTGDIARLNAALAFVMGLAD